MLSTQIILLAHDLRSCHNVGSLLRTAEGLGVKQVICSGYTPYPKLEKDSRLPHLSDKITRQIHKTALGAEAMLDIKHFDTLEQAIVYLRNLDFTVVAVEQSAQSINLNEYKPSEQIALVLGNEVEGLNKESLGLCDQVLEIPMQGKKESFNVVQATAMALYQLRFY
jgi:23S rRNA (guanosine2251-2'-O)-methyltransferase